MFVLPVVEIRNGESVHVLDQPSQGEHRPLLDPAEVATRLAALGAQGFYVVDVDHALDASKDNDEALVRLLDHNVLPVVAGGGVRSLKRIQELLDTGVRRVLVGTMGVLHPEWLKEAALVFRDRIVACIDTDGEKLLVKGRTETAPTTLEAHLSKIAAFGLESVHVTFSGKASDAPGVVEKVATRLKASVTFQGAVSGPAELEGLEKAGAKGVVLGAEIYDGRLRFDVLAKAYKVR